MGDRGQDGNSHAIGFRRMDAPAIHDPKMRGLGIKVGKQKVFVVLSLKKCNTPVLTPYESNGVKNQ